MSTKAQELEKKENELLEVSKRLELLQQSRSNVHEEHKRWLQGKNEELMLAEKVPAMERDKLNQECQRLKDDNLLKEKGIL